LVDLGDEYFEYWKYIEVVFLSEEGVSQYVDKLPYCEITSDIWSQVVCRLNGKCDESRRCCRFIVEEKPKAEGIESVIISRIPHILKGYEKKKWRLRYRGSRDGFRCSDFHGKCDNVPNTMTLISTTKNFILGGFTPISWDSSSQYKPDNSNQSFIFSVKNPHNIEGKIFSLTNSSRAIYCHQAYGPTFGNHSIYVSDNCNNNNTSYTYLGYSYANDTGMSGNQFCTGEQNFTVKDIEVFELTD
jgi:hypothetical protein